MSLASRNEAAYWRRMGDIWETWEAIHLYGLSSVDPYLFRVLALQQGERVLDIGCGIGEPALSAGAWVGPRGAVLGIDVSPGMIEVARRRARARGMRHVRFRVADVAKFRWSGRPFDAAVSRYALMFADDVETALTNVRGCLRRGARVALSVWGSEKGNAGFGVRMRAARPFQREGEDEHSLAKRGLSPLRFSDPKPLLLALRRCGFGNVRAERVRVGTVHQSPEAFARFTVESSMSELFGELSRTDRARLLRRLAEGAAAFRSGHVVRIPGEAWVVSARR